MSKAVSRNHPQAQRAARHGVGIEDGLTVGHLRYRRDAAMESRCVVNIPGIKGSVSAEMRREAGEGQHRLLVEGTERADIAFIEWQGVFSEHDIAVIGGGGGGNARSIAPEQFWSSHQAAPGWGSV